MNKLLSLNRNYITSLFTNTHPSANMCNPFTLTNIQQMDRDLSLKICTSWRDGTPKAGQGHGSLLWTPSK